MPTPIDDPDDPRIADFVNLRTDDVKDPMAAKFVAEGRLCCRRLAESEYALRSILVQNGRQDEAASWVDPDVPVYHADKRLLESITGFPFHRGFLASADRPKRTGIEPLLQNHSLPSRTIAAIGVSQRENLGSIIRTATAFGFDHLLLDPAAADPYSRRAVRTSMGTLFRQRVHSIGNESSDVVADIHRLNRAGYRTVATSIEPSSIDVDQWTPDDRPLVVLVGSEADGLPIDVQQSATDRVRIVMADGIDSLNVSVAAAICMHRLRVR